MGIVSTSGNTSLRRNNTRGSSAATRSKATVTSVRCYNTRQRAKMNPSVPPEEVQARTKIRRYKSLGGLGRPTIGFPLEMDSTTMTTVGGPNSKNNGSNSHNRPRSHPYHWFNSNHNLPTRSLSRTRSVHRPSRNSHLPSAASATPQSPQSPSIRRTMSESNLRTFAIRNQPEGHQLALSTSIPGTLFAINEVHEEVEEMLGESSADIMKEVAAYDLTKLSQKGDLPVDPVIRMPSNIRLDIDEASLSESVLELCPTEPDLDREKYQNVDDTDLQSEDMQLTPTEIVPREPTPEENIVLLRKRGIKVRDFALDPPSSSSPPPRAITEMFRVYEMYAWFWYMMCRRERAFVIPGPTSGRLIELGWVSDDELTNDKRFTDSDWNALLRYRVQRQKQPWVPIQPRDAAKLTPPTELERAELITRHGRSLQSEFTLRQFSHGLEQREAELSEHVNRLQRAAEFAALMYPPLEEEDEDVEMTDASGVSKGKKRARDDEGTDGLIINAKRRKMSAVPLAQQVRVWSTLLGERQHRLASQRAAVPQQIQPDPYSDESIVSSSQPVSSTTYSPPHVSRPLPASTSFIQPRTSRGLVRGGTFNHG